MMGKMGKHGKTIDVIPERPESGRILEVGFLDVGSNPA
jgi:hypothetical protein